MKKSELKNIIREEIKNNIREYDPDVEQLEDEEEIFMPVDDEGVPLGEGPQPGGAWELDGVIGFILTGGSKNPENWVFSPQQTEPGIHNVPKKFPYLAVANKLVRPKDHKPEGFGDYLKAGGRDWD